MWPWALGIAFGCVLGVGAIAGAAGVVLVREALSVRDDLQAAKTALTRIGGLIEGQDAEALQAAADDLSRATARAAETVDGPLWGLAAAIPGVGRNVDAVRRVTVAVDIVVQRALPAGIHVMSAIDLDHLVLESGGFDLEPLRQAQGSLPEIASAFADAEAEVAPVDEQTLLPVVAAPIAEALDIVRQAAPALDVVDRYLPTLLGIAGDGAPRTYLVIFQNNAEIRATGGNPAASMIITVDDGRIELRDQASSETFASAGTAGSSFTSLPAETLSLYPDTYPLYSQDYTMSPDFPTTAQLFQDLWLHTTGDRLDGVISIDPVALAEMLAVAGPVRLDGGEEITAANAVQTLLSDAYARYPEGVDSDRFFAEVAQRVFVHLTSSNWDPVAMLSALEQSADEQRIDLAFTDPDAQALAVELGVDGSLREDNSASTQVGVYLNDYSISKLEYYLSTTVSATCDIEARTITTTVSMQNSAPDSLTGGYRLGQRNVDHDLPRTAMMLDVLFFAPPGASILSIEPAHGDIPGLDRSGVEKGNTAQSVLVVVGQGETRTVSSTVQLPDGPLGPLELRHSPTATDTPVTIDASCDELFAVAG